MAGRPKKDKTLRENDSIQYVNVPLSKELIAKIDAKLNGAARCRYIIQILEKYVK